MRIALVSDWTAPRLGGIERQVQGLAEQLRERGHDVRVITFTAGPDAVAGIPVHRLASVPPPGWRRLQRGLNAVGMELGDPLPPRITRALVDILEEQRVEVVHGHSFWSALAAMAIKLARARGIAGVLTNHSLLERAGILFFRAYDEAVGWSAWPGVLTAVSGVAAADARHASRRVVRVIPNGLDTTAWAYARMVPSADPSLRVAGPGRRVVAVMRLSARKSPETLLRAMVRARAELAGDAPRVDVYGDGPDRAALELRAAELGLAGLVTFHGARPPGEIADALALADLFVLPGAREAFGIAAAEALAAGVPVIAMAGCGVSDVFADGVAGLFVRDADELGAAIARLVTDGALRARMAAAAPGQVARFDWDHVAPAYLSAYEDALSAL